MFKISHDLNKNIFSFLANEDNMETNDFWKTYFSKKVLININPKDYYNKYILPEIDQGWKLVGINDYAFCNYCLITREINNECNNCSIHTPCLNCYFYGTCDDCSNQFIIISRKMISVFIVEI